MGVRGELHEGVLTIDRDLADLLALLVLYRRGELRRVGLLLDELLAPAHRPVAAADPLRLGFVDLDFCFVLHR